MTICGCCAISWSISFFTFVGEFAWSESTIKVLALYSFWTYSATCWVHSQYVLTVFSQHFSQVVEKLYCILQIWHNHINSPFACWWNEIGTEHLSQYGMWPHLVQIIPGAYHFLFTIIQIFFLWYNCFSMADFTSSEKW